MLVFGRNASVTTLLGGLVFAASIGYCAWTYAVTWRVPRASRLSPAALGVDVLLFVAFAAHHSLTARAPVKRRIAAAVGEASTRSAYVWIASVLLAVVCAAWQPVGGLVYRQGGALLTAHAAVQLAGIWLAVEAVRRIDALELAGFDPAAPTCLRRGGPYRWLRHPLYTGWMLIAFGAATMTADRLAFAVITSAYLLIAIPWEEASLRRTFGDRYV
jgi:protein-S-isoprenylcysteine O-methyltransferase Ste14